MKVILSGYEKEFNTETLACLTELLRQAGLKDATVVTEILEPEEVKYPSRHFELVFRWADNKCIKGDCQCLVGHSANHSERYLYANFRRYLSMPDSVPYSTWLDILTTTLGYEAIETPDGLAIKGLMVK